jgi:hypothetical protein
MPADPNHVWNHWVSLLTPAAKRGQERFRRIDDPLSIGPMWHVVVVDEVPEPTVVSLSSLPELISFLSSLSKQASATIVYGIRGLHGVSRQSTVLRFFLHPNGQRYDLFNRDADIIVDEHGYMGDRPADLSPSSATTLSLMHTHVNSNRPQPAHGEEAEQEELPAGFDDFDGELGDDVDSDDL